MTPSLAPILQRAGETTATLQAELEALLAADPDHGVRAAFVASACAPLGWLVEILLRLEGLIEAEDEALRSACATRLAAVLGDLEQSLREGDETFLADLLRFEMAPALADTRWLAATVIARTLDAPGDA